MYSPPIKYDDFLQKFPTEANAFQFYQKSYGIYCPSCGDKQFSYLRDDKPYMAYCKKCHRTKKLTAKIDIMKSRY